MKTIFRTTTNIGQKIIVQIIYVSVKVFQWE